VTPGGGGGDGQSCGGGGDAQSCGGGGCTRVGKNATVRARALATPSSPAAATAAVAAAEAVRRRARVRGRRRRWLSDEAAHRFVAQRDRYPRDRAANRVAAQRYRWPGAKATHRVVGPYQPYCTTRRNIRHSTASHKSRSLILICSSMAMRTSLVTQASAWVVLVVPSSATRLPSSVHVRAGRHKERPGNPSWYPQYCVSSACGGTGAASPCEGNAPGKAHAQKRALAAALDIIVVTLDRSTRSAVRAAGAAPSDH
jgi:hypothetical protein